MTGNQTSTCGVLYSGGFFKGPHNAGYGCATDADADDNIGCWRWQVVPRVLYTGEGYSGLYLDSISEHGSLHEWQSLWDR